MQVTNLKQTMSTLKKRLKKEEKHSAFGLLTFIIYKSTQNSVGEQFNKEFVNFAISL